MKIITPKFSMECGYGKYQTKFSFSLSFVQRRLGVLVSGGLDSAFLYYLIRLLADERYTITPFVIDKNDRAKEFAPNIINYVNFSLNKPNQDITYVDIEETDDNLQVWSGTKKIEQTNVNKIYVGLIQTLPDHALHVPKPIIPAESLKTTYPFRNLNKSHIVDMIIKLKQEKLFEITHSCVYNIEGRCNSCNRCNERLWAFNQIGLKDPGIL